MVVGRDRTRDIHTHQVNLPTCCQPPEYAPTYHDVLSMLARSIDCLFVWLVGWLAVSVRWRDVFPGVEQGREQGSGGPQRGHAGAGRCRGRGAVCAVLVVIPGTPA